MAKLTIPKLLKLAIETNNMSYVAKAYEAITGVEIIIQKTINIDPSNLNSTAVPESISVQGAKPQNKFVDDGTIARSNNKGELAKLYGNSPVSRRSPYQSASVQCSCGQSEEVPADLARAYASNDGPTFKCQRCIVQR